jgi:hypothetical protein
MNSNFISIKCKQGKLLALSSCFFLIPSLYAYKKGFKGIVSYVAANPSVWIAFLILLANIARFLLFVYFLYLPSVSKYVRSFIFILIAYFVVAAGPIANTRYLLPVSLLIIACAAIAANDIIAKQMARKHEKKNSIH